VQQPEVLAQLLTRDIRDLTSRSQHVLMDLLNAPKRIPSKCQDLTIQGTCNGHAARLTQ
jgi:hypothetical protein